MRESVVPEPDGSALVLKNLNVVRRKWRAR